MTPNIQSWVESNRPKYSGEVLEIGSLNVNGGVRHFFQDAISYVGIDMVPGKGVDRVASGHDIKKIFVEPFDTIICLETIEHDPEFWKLIAAIGSMLRVGGHLILSSPTIDFPIHHEPDYYRFTKAGIGSLVELAGCEVSLIDSLPDTIGKNSIISLGRKK